MWRKIENPFLRYLKIFPKDSKILLIILHTCVEAAPCIMVQPKITHLEACERKGVTLLWKEKKNPN
jgi:hypothetical protein